MNKTAFLHEELHQVVEFLGFNPESLQTWQIELTAWSLLLTSGLLVWIAVRAVFLIYLPTLAKRTEKNWSHCLIEVGFFRRLAHLFPGFFIYYSYEYLFTEDSLSFSVLQKLSVLYLILAGYMLVQALLSGIERIYKTTSLAQKAPITGFIQVARLFFTLVLIFSVLSVFLDKSPVYLLSGLTAIAAVLLLVFKDTILGLVAGIQIAANRMFNTGDWIEIPKFGVDGDILQIGLTVVKVQNWDKTIATIPTYAMISEPVKNWRGMKDAGGRRIKRSIKIDMHSVRFATNEDIKAWAELSLLEDYLTNKGIELEKYNGDISSLGKSDKNQRRLTNLGTFRAYLSAFIRQSEKTHPNLTCMVRQLAPSEVGIPLEIYCFTKTTNWEEYEGVQSDLFDHILAVMKEFDLIAYQRVSAQNNAR